MTDMSSQLFGTDGIRGPVGAYPLNETGLLQIGKAVGAYFTKPGDEVLIGWDPRESSETLANAAVKGLISMGVQVRKLGVLPTPGLAYLTKRLGAKAGVMITASHNPYTDNGVKVFTPDGRKLSDKDQAGLNELINNDIAALESGKAVDDVESVKLYEDFLVEAAEGVSLESLKLAVDSANGATSGLAGRVFSRLGASVTAVFDRPDGRNINVDCGATDTAALQKLVQEHDLDAGAAFDGDGDRLILVDAEGRQLTGDHVIYILAMASGYTGVVATIMSNQGLETILAAHDIKLERTPVGDRSVLQGMDNTGYRLGGEQSGHVILYDYSTTGDGLLAAVRALVSSVQSGKTLAKWYDELELLPQALISLPFPDKTLLERPDVQAFIDDAAAELGDQGRLNVRPSGTEPKVRIMVEAPDAKEQAQQIADGLVRLTGGA